ncbi:hypothetical protein JMN32_20505 [Fulvivirga sp. 29W222]|uniref:BZIP transcription factor n=1 Tax=Fulvivirga marina TaxID=2494733 RepID=A0A937G5C0_9BACT|nr:hypothetical protein [Fulvivirga marina]MBL6448706.1 hypothetical protein [Fulvivirga marina]
MNYYVRFLLQILCLIVFIGSAKAQWVDDGGDGIGDIYYNNGNVGVGTINPQRKFHISEEGMVQLRLERPYTSEGFSDIGSASGHLYFYPGGYTLKNGNFIVHTSGNVGIGTTSPMSKLDVDGAVLASEFKLHSGDGKSALYMQEASTSTDPFRLTLGGQTIAGGIMIGREDWMSKVMIPWNVGIGTNDPGSFKLAVEGKIGAREIQVTSVTPWPDYVFEEGYNLTELSEVERYVKENKHLPGIPTANDVEEDGVNLGEMNAKLLEKVEELTLYLIEMKKENEELKTRVKKLEDGYE